MGCADRLSRFSQTVRSAVIATVRTACGIGRVGSGDVLRPLQPVERAPGQQWLSFAWLGSALQATQLSFGTVCAPGQRYHPAVVAQAAATLAQMYPDRFWLALGSGE